MKACEGAETISIRKGMEYFEECLDCGSCVRHDLVDHKILGFKASCPKYLDKLEASGAEGKDGL